jgi:hypothetical protein
MSEDGTAIAGRSRWTMTPHMNVTRPSKLHYNAGARLQSEILLLPSSLFPTYTTRPGGNGSDAPVINSREANDFSAANENVQHAALGVEGAGVAPEDDTPSSGSRLPSGSGPDRSESGVSAHPTSNDSAPDTRRAGPPAPSPHRSAPDTSATARPGAWHLVPSQKGRNIIYCKWVYKIKRKQDESLKLDLLQKI